MSTLGYSKRNQINHPNITVILAARFSPPWSLKAAQCCITTNRGQKSSSPREEEGAQLESGSPSRTGSEKHTLETPHKKGGRTQPNAQSKQTQFTMLAP